jgi:hypothetical protein
MLLLKKNVKKLLEEIRKANRHRKRNEPMITFTLMVKSDGVTFPGRVGFISGEAPVSFWKSKQAENIAGL